MESILTTVLPVFGLIVLGYLFARLKLLDSATARGLTQFVFMIAIPAPVSYTHLRAHETVLDLVCRLLLDKTKQIHRGPK